MSQDSRGVGSAGDELERLNAAREDHDPPGTAGHEDAVEALRRSEQAYQNLFDQMFDAFAVYEFAVDDDGVPVDYRFVSVNPAFEAMTGLRAEAIIGKTVAEVLPGTASHWVEAYDSVAETGQPLQFEDVWEEFDKHFEVHAFRPEPGRLGCVFHDVTDRQRAQSLVRESGERLRLALQAASMGTWEWDIVANRLVWSPEIYTLFSIAPDEFGGTYEAYLGFAAPEVREAVDKRVQAFLSSAHESAVIQYEHEIIRGDGKSGWIEVRGTLFLDPQGQPVRMTGICADIAARKQIEATIRESEARFRGLVESSGDWIWEVNADGVYTYVSPRIERMLGYKPEEVIGKTPFDLMPSEEAERVGKIFRNAIVRGVPIVAMENVNLHKDGRLVVLETSGVPIVDGAGNVCGYRGVDRDITERKHGEAALRERETRLRSVFRAAPTGIGVVVDRVLKEANDRMCEMTGYRREELIGQNARMLYLSDEDYDYVGREKYEQIRDHGTGTVETQWKRKDGRIIDVLLSSTPMDLADLSTGVTFTALDITERTRAVGALRRSEQRFRRIFEDGPIGMAVLDRQCRFTRVNPALCGLLGYRGQELIQKALEDVTDADDVEADLHLAGQLFAGEIPAYTLEKRCIRQDGQLVWTSVTASAIHGDDGQAEFMLHIIEDISERKRAAETLEQLNRELLDRNNELASVLHAASQDLRDPLLSIQGFTRELALACSEVRQILDGAAIDESTRQRLAPVLERDIAEAVPIILQAVTRVDILIDGLARMSRLSRESLEIGPLDMNAVLADVVGPLAIRARACEATLQVDDVPPCLGDRPRISQVFAVVLDNALTYLDPARRGMIRVSGRVEGGQAIYCVEDNGVGIPRERQGQCFDLFFSRSLSDSPVGTGLGLAIARRILDRHDGRTWVESEPGEGSRFYVSLPAVDS